MPAAAGWIVYVRGEDHVIWGSHRDYDKALELARAEMALDWSEAEPEMVTFTIMPATQALLDADASDWDDFGWEIVNGVAAMTGE